MEHQTCLAIPNNENQSELQIKLLLNWGSLPTKLNSHYEAWSYRKRSTK